MQASGTAGDRQAELDAVQAQIAALPEPTQPTIDPALAGEQAARATAVAQILGGRLTWERVLGDVSRVLPSGVSLTELTATAPQPTTPEAARHDHRGHVLDGEHAAPRPAAGGDHDADRRHRHRLRVRLRRHRADARSPPGGSEPHERPAAERDADQVGKKRVIEFTIVADLATPGGVQ